MLRWLLAALAATTLACDEVRVIQGSPDAGHHPDASLDAAAPADAAQGVPDAAPRELDAGAPDASAPDASAADAAPLDASGCSSLAAPRTTLVDAPGAAASSRSIVADGAGYAATWLSLASSSPVVYRTRTGRLTAAGDVVPGSVHALWPGSGESHGPSQLAVGPGGLAVAMIRGGTSGLTEANRAWFARLDANGEVLSGTERMLSGEHAPHLSVAVAWSPTARVWAVVWQGTEPLGGGMVHSHVYLTRIAEDGTILSPSAVRLDTLASTGGLGDAPSLVWNGERFALVVLEYAAVEDARVVVVEIEAATGDVTRRILVDAPGRPLRATIATDGEIYGVAWMRIHTQDPTHNDVRFARAAVGGDALGPAVTVSDPMLGAGEPALVFDGSSFRLYFDAGDASRSGVWRARFSAGGALLEPAAEVLQVTAPYSAFPFAASDGCSDAVLWTWTHPTQPQTADIHAWVSPR